MKGFHTIQLTTEEANLIASTLGTDVQEATEKERLLHYLSLLTKQKKPTERKLLVSASELKMMVDHLEDGRGEADSHKVDKLSAYLTHQSKK